MPAQSTYTDAAAAPGGAGTEIDPYGSWIEWEANEGTNLVTDGDTHTLFVTGFEVSATQCLLNGFTTGASNYLTIKAASGQEASGIYGVTGFSASSTSRSVLNYAEHLRIEDVQIESTYTSSSIALAQSWNASGIDIRVDRCIINNADTGNTSGVINDGGAYTGTYLYRNCVLDPGTTSVYDHNSTSIDTYLYNNTILGRCILRDNTTCYLTNNIIDTADAILTYGGTVAVGINNTHSQSVAGDAYTAGSSGNKWSQTFTYTDSANDDYSLDSGDTGAIGNGTDLTSDATWPFSIDIIGASRGATWDCGAFGSVAGGATLTVQNCLHGHTVDSPVLVQANTLVVDDTLHANSVDSVVLQTAVILSVDSVLHSHSVDNLDLLQANVLLVDDALHGHQVDGVDLVQANVLAVNDALHTHAVDNLSLDVSTVLVVQDALHGHTIDNVDLTQANVLSVQDAVHGHGVDNLDLVQANILAVDSALHAHLVDNILLNTGAAPVTGDRVVVVANENRTVLVVDESRLVEVANEIRRVTFN